MGRSLGLASLGSESSLNPFALRYAGTLSGLADALGYAVHASKSMTLGMQLGWKL